MKNRMLHKWCFLMITLAGLFVASCDLDEIPDPNNPSAGVIENNASLSEIQNLVDGILSWIRDRHATYLDGVGMIGREYYRFSGADPRFTSDLLGKANAVLDNNTFYTTRPFQSRYQVVKNCNILLKAIDNTKAAVTAEQVRAVKGFAKTIMAHELLMVLNQQYNNGVRVSVGDPDNLGPFLDYAGSLNAIAGMLDEGLNDLEAGGSSFPFRLHNGYTGFNTPGQFSQFNRALAARVDAYRGDWGGVLEALNKSFYSLDADKGLGVYNVFSQSGGDQLNEMWYPLNATGELRVAHPSFVTNALPNDNRLGKVTKRNEAAFQDNLTSEYDFTLYPNNTAPIAVIRNEELVLLFAEANAQNGSTSNALDGINKVRNWAGVGNYNGATDKDALLNEILFQRRYSLFGEGHRWIDMRRYNKLGDLPIDRQDDDVWTQFPRPATEN